MIVFLPSIRSNCLTDKTLPFISTILNLIDLLCFDPNITLNLPLLGLGKIFTNSPFNVLIVLFKILPVVLTMLCCTKSASTASVYVVLESIEISSESNSPRV